MTNTDDTDRAVVEALRHRDAIVLTATDLADQLDISRSTLYDRLRALEADDVVGSVQVGRGRGWYLPGDMKSIRATPTDRLAIETDEQIVIPTYHAYVRRPVDARGRVTIGADYAQRHVTFAILDAPATVAVAPSDWDYRKPLKYQRAVAVDDDVADDRGRIKLHTDYAEQEVSLAVLEVAE